MPVSSTLCTSPTPSPLVVSPAKPRHAECSETSISFVTSDFGCSSLLSASTSEPFLQPHSNTANVQVTVNAALTSQIELLEVENRRLKNQLQVVVQSSFRIKCISHDDALVSLYIGFSTFDVLRAFFRFLGPSVGRLQT